MKCGLPQRVTKVARIPGRKVFESGRWRWLEVEAPCLVKQLWGKVFSWDSRDLD